jgi:hypothetical protein
MTNTNKKNKNTRKLLGAVGMLSVSAAMLVSSTFAWFTMNKEVKAVGMEVKAHAEEGLLINEVKAANSKTWDEQAQGDETATLISLRPASSSALTTFWHANSKKSADEAGLGDDKGNTVVISGEGENAVLYKDVTNIAHNDIVAADNAADGSKAETTVYYENASFGGTDDYQDGEGFYVKYTYYLKSSKSGSSLTVNNLQAQVKAVKTDGSEDKALDNALRVGVKYGNTGMKIFAPVKNAVASPNGTATTGPSTSYSVTNDAKGSAGTTVEPVVASATGEFTAYTQINTSAETIPAVTENGAPVYVYVWFEGEDINCMSDNITAALAAYDITVNFKDADL